MRHWARIACALCFAGSCGLAACGSTDEDGKGAIDGSVDAGNDAAADGGKIDCSRVGCSPPPMCDVGCTAECGCCPCAEGETMGSYVCTGGCWSAPLTDAGGEAGNDAGDAGKDGSGIDCSRVGCSMPPMCDVGCTAECGCCPCAEGETMGSFVCKGGCWAPASADGGEAG